MVQSDDGGRKDTLISGISEEDVEINLDLPEQELIEQSVKADKKLQLLFKQIEIMKSRAKLN